MNKSDDSNLRGSKVTVGARLVMPNTDQHSSFPVKLTVLLWWNISCSFNTSWVRYFSLWLHFKSCVLWASSPAKEISWAPQYFIIVTLLPLSNNCSLWHNVILIIFQFNVKPSEVRTTIKWYYMSTHSNFQFLNAKMHYVCFIILYCNSELISWYMLIPFLIS